MPTIKHTEEFVYPAVERGILRIDSMGRIWRGTQRAEHDQGQYLTVRWMTGAVRHNAQASRLIWRHLHGPIPGYLTINHKNGNKKDNHPSNLELATYREQAIHAMRVLGKNKRLLKQNGEANHMARLTEPQVREAKRLRAAGMSLTEVERLTGVPWKEVSRISLGVRWGHVTL